MDNTLTVNLPIFVKYPFCLLKQGVGSKIIIFVIAGLIFFLLGFYLFQIGEIVKLNYLLKNSEQELKNISEQKLDLTGKTAELFSFQELEKELKDFNFVRVSEVKYIPISAEYLVKGFVQNYKAEPQ
ncbi:MAG: hypothetical protein QMC93_03270 [Patescibacteria group bacterium]|nr:hypothetical protein [Patescibacteria group bacterium]